MLEFIIFQNSLKTWLIALVIMVALWLAFKIFQEIIIGKIKKITEKTENKFDDIAVDAIRSIHWPFFALLSFYIALHFIYVPDFVKNWTFYIFLVTTVFYTIKFLEKFIDHSVILFIEKKEKEEEGAGIIRLLAILAKISLWFGAVVLLLSNMGYNVTSIIAGLGIGGIAIALALQNILGDLFSSLTIYLDKPFKIGDFIMFGDHAGTVKKVGIKSTRIQLLQGEELVVSNQQLSNGQIRNYGLMEKRRIVLLVGVSYNTPENKLKKIPEYLEEIIKKQDDVEIQRIHFKELGDFSLKFEAVYFINNSDYGTYMDKQQNINLGIIKKFAQEKIEIAFPTQTVYIKGSSLNT